jgi:hypothetical protein
MTMAEMERRLESLERRVQELEKRPVEMHFHQHGLEAPAGLLFMPGRPSEWPPSPLHPSTITC